MKTALLVGGLPLANQLHRLETGVQVHVAVMRDCWGILLLIISFFP